MAEQKHSTVWKDRQLKWKHRSQGAKSSYIQGSVRKAKTRPSDKFSGENDDLAPRLSATLFDCIKTKRKE